VGILLVISGYYKIIRNNCRAKFNKVDECKILSGGQKTGKNYSYVVFTNNKNTKSEKVNNESLEKVKVNTLLLNSIPINILIDSLIDAYEIYNQNPQIIINRIILHLILKI
ncbi:MAG: hypothetical protein ACK56I_28010, partial [bacterium]